MQVITIATEKNHHLERLLFSAAQFDITVKILGEGEHYDTHNVKTEILLNYLDTVPAEETVLYVDGYDCIFLKGIDEILQTYKVFNHPLVMGTEQNFRCVLPFFKKLGYYYRYPKGKRPYRFINAGTWIGKAGYAREILSQVNEKNGDDQTLLNVFFTKHPEKLCLDYRHEIFSCTAGRMGLEENDYAVHLGRLRNTVTGSYPAVFHAAGENFHGLSKVISLLPFMPPEKGVSEHALKQYAKYRRWNSVNAAILPDNFLFHLLLKTAGFALAILLLLLFIA